MKTLFLVIHSQSMPLLCYFLPTRLHDEPKKEIAEKRPFLKPWIEKKGFDVMPVFRVVDCVACVWTMETNLLPKEYVKL